MKQTSEKLMALGLFIEACRRQMNIRTDLLCADVKCSKSTYCTV